MIKDKKISIETIVVQNKAIDVSDLNGEKVMMNLEKGEYFVLNEVGSKIWDIIFEPNTVKEIVNTLLNEYNTDNITCKDNTLEYLEKLYHAEIIRIR